MRCVDRPIARDWKNNTDFPASKLVDHDFGGVDGAFRFGRDGVAARALEVQESARRIDHHVCRLPRRARTDEAGHFPTAALPASAGSAAIEFRPPRRAGSLRARGMPHRDPQPAAAPLGQTLPYMRSSAAVSNGGAPSARAAMRSRFTPSPIRRPISSVFDGAVGRRKPILALHAMAVAVDCRQPVLRLLVAQRGKPSAPPLRAGADTA